MKKRILALGMVLALVAVLAAPMVVLAAGTGHDTTTVSGTNPTTYALVPPDDITLSTFVVGSNSAINKTVKAQTNDASVSAVKMEVRDQKTSDNIGYMQKADITKLSAKFQVQGGDLGTGSWTSLPEAVMGTLILEDYGSLSGTPPYYYQITDFGVNQPIANLAAEAAGDYSITLLFIATFPA